MAKSNFLSVRHSSLFVQPSLLTASILLLLVGQPAQVLGADLITRVQIGGSCSAFDQGGAFASADCSSDLGDRWLSAAGSANATWGHLGVKITATMLTYTQPNGDFVSKGYSYASFSDGMTVSSGPFRWHTPLVISIDRH